MNRILPFCIALAAAAGGILAYAWSQEPAVPPVATSKDAYANGCVSCHIDDGAGNGKRLSTLLAAVEGHPKVTVVSKVPADCAKCHKAGGGIEGFNTLMHKVHYAGLEKSEFLTFVQGSCLNCHSLDPKTGKMTIKSGPKNW